MGVGWVLSRKCLKHASRVTLLRTLGVTMRQHSLLLRGAWIPGSCPDFTWARWRGPLRGGGWRAAAAGLALQWGCGGDGGSGGVYLSHSLRKEDGLPGSDAQKALLASSNLFMFLSVFAGGVVPFAGASCHQVSLSIPIPSRTAPLSPHTRTPPSPFLRPSP